MRNFALVRREGASIGFKRCPDPILSLVYEPMAANPGASDPVEFKRPTCGDTQALQYGAWPFVYLEAIRLGIDTLHIAVPPLANGTGKPSIFNILKNISYMGRTANLNEDALLAYSQILQEIAEKEGRPAGNGAGETEGTVESERPGLPERPRELPPGAVPCGMAGLILSIEVKVGAHVNEGDLVAIIEAMKMRRHVNSPRKGVVKEILAREGEMVAPEDILMVVE